MHKLGNCANNGDREMYIGEFDCRDYDRYDGRSFEGIFTILLMQYDLFFVTVYVYPTDSNDKLDRVSHGASTKTCLYRNFRILTS